MLGVLSAFVAVLSGVAQAAPSGRDLSSLSFIQGTYNYSSFAFPLPLSQARAILPSRFAKLPDEQLFLRPSTGPKGEQTTLAVIETGRQLGNGPPGLPVLYNEESKLQLPYIARVAGSSQPFIFKSNIFVDSPVGAGSGALVFGLNETLASFQPPNSATAPNYDTATTGWFDISGVSTTPSDTSGIDWTEIANMPWFGSGPQCGRHQYQPPTFSLPLSAGQLTLYGKVLKQQGLAPVTYTTVPGLHNVADYKIYGPSSCSSFVTTLQ